MKKVVILITKAGGGHLSLAQGLKSSLDNYYPTLYDIVIHDPSPSLFSNLYPYITSGKLSFIWKGLWHITNSGFGSNLVTIFNDLSFGKRLVKDLKLLKPDLVVTNSPITIKELKKAKKRSGLNFLTCIHVADPFTPHNTWFTYPDVDLMLVPTDKCSKIGVSKSIPKEKIKRVGWLTRDPFLRREIGHKVSNVRDLYSVSKNDFLIFLSGSGGQENLSLSFVKNYINSGLYLKSKLIINTGLSPTYLFKMSLLVRKYKIQISLVPFTGRMELYLQAANLVVGKAGPNFLFECIHANKPILALGCIPGQEAGNLDYIESQNIGWYINKPVEYIALIDRVINNPDILKKPASNMLRIAKKHQKTSQNIAREIFSLLK